VYVDSRRGQVRGKSAGCRRTGEDTVRCRKQRSPTQTANSWQNRRWARRANSPCQGGGRVACRHRRFELVAWFRLARSTGARKGTDATRGPAWFSKMWYSPYVLACLSTTPRSSGATAGLSPGNRLNVTGRRSRSAGPSLDVATAVECCHGISRATRDREDVASERGHIRKPRQREGPVSSCAGFRLGKLGVRLVVRLIAGPGGSGELQEWEVRRRWRRSGSASGGEALRAPVSALRP